MEDGKVDANKEQNRAKNNFCAAESAVSVTKKTFKDLQTKAEALEKATAGAAHPFTFGSHDMVPEDRSAIRANGSIRRRTATKYTKARWCELLHF